MKLTKTQRKGLPAMNGWRRWRLGVQVTEEAGPRTSRWSFFSGSVGFCRIFGDSIAGTESSFRHLFDTCSTLTGHLLDTYSTPTAPVGGLPVSSTGQAAERGCEGRGPVCWHRRIVAHACGRVKGWRDWQLDCSVQSAPSPMSFRKWVRVRPANCHPPPLITVTSEDRYA